MWNLDALPAFLYLEMAERHNAKQVLRIARDLVYKLQDLIENKWNHWEKKICTDLCAVDSKKRCLLR